MLREMCKTKIHRLTVTQTDINYQGSLTLDKKLMVAADILQSEKVHVLNLSNGERAATYAIPAAPGSGKVCLNGAVARLGQPGDKIIVLTYAILSEEEVRKHRMKVVFVNEKNHVARVTEK